MKVEKKGKEREIEELVELEFLETSIKMYQDEPQDSRLSFVVEHPESGATSAPASFQVLHLYIQAH